jgi:UDP-glucose 4-epimerase
MGNGKWEDKIMIFGDDYPTEDGTCVRDYIHVTDLADAHIKAMARMKNTNESAIYNLGNGKGFSVKEVIDVCRRVTGHSMPAEVQARRAGDPAILVASSDKATRELGLEPRFAELEKIVATAWEFVKARENVPA